MPLLSRLSSLWRNLFRRARKEQELTEEIDVYLEMLIEQKVKEGLAPEEARREALIELGGKQQVKEKVRDVRAGHLLETLWQDLRYGLRMLGFNRENVLLISTDPEMIGYQSRARQIVDLYQRMLERIKAIPGVRSVSLSGQGLLSGIGTKSMGGLQVQGQPPRRFISELCVVGPDYFETVGMTILRGRGFTAQDHEKAPRVAVVNETFVRQYLGGDNELGQRFRLGPDDSEIEVVGIVKDAKYDNLREEARHVYYVPYVQASHFWRATTFQIRTAADPTQIIAAARQAAREIDANLPLFKIKTLATQVDETLVQERLIGTVSSFFGLLSLLLAAIGLYGIMAYSVNHRTHEIGIRLALGAQRGEVLRMVLSRGMKLVLIGVVFGLAASFAATRLVASYLFGVTATDPATFVGVPILLLIVALLACFVPARRATRVDPLVALRDE